MDDSNPVVFTVTSLPLPSGWLDQDVGSVGLAGTASYSNGTFTINAAGAGIFGTADAFHFVYQPLNGDGTVIAQVVSLQGGAPYESAGVMIATPWTQARRTPRPPSGHSTVGFSLMCARQREEAQRSRPI